MNESTDAAPIEAQETDPRFPSGPWTGYFLQKEVPGRHQMELKLSFAAGTLQGEGRDWVGPFHVRGRYNVDDGQCYWTKRYVGKHDVTYKGYAEAKGIWGMWELVSQGIASKGGFHIWPEGLPDPTTDRLAAEAEIPDAEFISSEIGEPELAPVGQAGAR